MTLFVTADLHFGHKGMLNMTRPDGSPQRPWQSVEEHDEAIIDNWNRVVAANDKVYVLGDVAFSRQSLTDCVGRLNGTKVLIKGNHDIYKPHEYLEVFKDIRAGHNLHLEQGRFWLSHIPIHPACLERWVGNIHGHLHHDSIDDPRYHCVSLERTQYKPIAVEELIRCKPCISKPLKELTWN